jgi:hypothetical protein
MRRCCNRCEIGLGLRKLGRQRRLDLLVQGASRVAGRLAVGDGLVEHALLARVEVKLVLGVRDQPADLDSARAGMAVWTVGLRQRHAGAKCRRDRDGDNRRCGAEPAVERHVMSFRVKAPQRFCGS